MHLFIGSADLAQLISDLQKNNLSLPYVVLNVRWAQVAGRDLFEVSLTDKQVKHLLNNVIPVKTITERYHST